MENKRIVASWQENGMLYTLTATPIDIEIHQELTTNTKSSGMVSVFEYFGNRTPEHGTGAKVYAHAKNVNANYEAGYVNTPYYQGQIMLYERSFLDDYFNNNPTATAVVEDDYDLPF
jgi:hypothetical protein